MKKMTVFILVLMVSTMALSAQMMVVKSDTCALKVAQRDSTVTDARNKLEELIQQPVPKELTKEQVKNWKEQTQWLKSVSERLAAYQEKQKQSSEPSEPVLTTKVGQPKKVTVKQKEAATTAMTATTQTNMEFQNLQNSIQMESRKFQTLSNAAKARHDVAMAAVRNLK